MSLNPLIDYFMPIRCDVCAQLKLCAPWAESGYDQVLRKTFVDWLLHHAKCKKCRDGDRNLKKMCFMGQQALFNFQMVTYPYSGRLELIEF